MVCTGNICRSPVAAAVLAAALPGAEVRSAGTNAVVGAPADPTMSTLAGELGHDLSGHRSRRLVAPLVDQADLVVTMTREHRSAVVALVPRAVRRTFTLVELARVVDELAHPLSGATLRADVPALAGLRHPHPDGPSADDIPDPYGMSERYHRVVLAMIAGAVARITG